MFSKTSFFIRRLKYNSLLDKIETLTNKKTTISILAPDSITVPLWSRDKKILKETALKSEQQTYQLFLQNKSVAKDERSRV